jgi:hypothetical protein
MELPEHAHLAPTTPAPTGTLAVTWKRAVKVWWSIAWRAFVFCGLGGGLIGGVLGAVYGFRGLPIPFVTIQFLGWLASIPIMIWITRTILSKSWADFRIILVARDSQ